MNIGHYQAEQQAQEMLRNKDYQEFLAQSERARVLRREFEYAMHLREMAHRRFLGITGSHNNVTPPLLEHG